MPKSSVELIIQIECNSAYQGSYTRAKRKFCSSGHRCGANHWASDGI